MILHPLLTKDVARGFGIHSNKMGEWLKGSAVKPVAVKGKHYYPARSIGHIAYERACANTAKDSFNCGVLREVRQDDPISDRQTAAIVAIRKNIPDHPECNLMGGIIEQAIRDLSVKQYADEALWFLSSDMPQAQMVDINPEYVRRVLRQHYLV